jgi:hypothetical protein
MEALTYFFSFFPDLISLPSQVGAVIGMAPTAKKSVSAIRG